MKNIYEKGGVYEDDDKIFEKFEIKLDDSDDAIILQETDHKNKLRNIEPDTDLIANKSISNFKIGKVYFLLNFGLVAGGKSTLLNILQKAIEAENYKDSINLMYISSDAFRRVLIDKHMEKNPNIDFNTAHEKVGKAYKNGFDKEILKILHHKKDPSKINLFYIDKNFIPKTAESLYDTIFREYDKKGNFEFYIFHPKIKYPINVGNLTYPFSMSYFIQSYYRLKNRKDHESLDFEKNPHAHYILISFLTLFKGESDFKVGHDGKYKISLIPTSFSDEKQLNISNEILTSFKNMMNKISKKPFDVEYISDFDFLINEFFTIIENVFPFQMFEDTRGEMFDEIKMFLRSKINSNQIII